jgi:hypothetical protein
MQLQERQEPGKLSVLILEVDGGGGGVYSACGCFLLYINITFLCRVAYIYMYKLWPLWRSLIQEIV